MTMYIKLETNLVKAMIFPLYSGQPIFLLLTSIIINDVRTRTHGFNGFLRLSCCEIILMCQKDVTELKGGNPTLESTKFAKIGAVMSKFESSEVVVMVVVVGENFSFRHRCSLVGFVVSDAGSIPSGGTRSHCLLLEVGRVLGWRYAVCVLVDIFSLYSSPSSVICSFRIL